MLESSILETLERMEESMTDERIERVFSYHPPFGNQGKRYQKIRLAAGGLATLMAANCPDSQESEIAFMKLREAVMWANAAIACNEKDLENTNGRFGRKKCQ